MLNKSDWILDLLKQYKHETSQKPVFISDWDAWNEQALYPEKYIKNALDIDVSLTLPYTFSDEQGEIKQLIIDIFEDHSLKIKQDQIAISISATAAIYLSLISLYRQGYRKFLLFTPVYYAIVETLRDIGVEVYYYHLTDRNDFEIDIMHVEEIISAYKVDVLVLSDPVYCVGKGIELTILNEIIGLCRKHDSCLFLDNTLGGLEWQATKTDLFNFEKIKLLNGLENFVLIDSLTKRLLINALKHAIVLTSDKLAVSIEDFASQVYGGFCYPQLQLMNELYDRKNVNDIRAMLDHNVGIIKNNYELLTGFFANTDYRLYPADSGYFTMIANVKHLCNEVDIEAQIRHYLYTFNAFLLPPWYFYFDNSNHFSIRVNLLKEPSTYLAVLGDCIGENVKLLH